MKDPANGLIYNNLDGVKAKDRRKPCRYVLVFKEIGR
jgi:hypothetical protein